MPVILSTKILNSQQRNLFSQNGILLIEEDFISVETIDFEIPTSYQFVIFTSQNAVESVMKNVYFQFLKKKKTLCVGEKTKLKLQKLGFEVIESTHYAEDLAKIIQQKYINESFLFFCGNLHRDTLPKIMRENKITFSEIEVYKNYKTPKRINEKLDGILFFSPSGVESFLTENKISTEKLFCIGTTTASALSNFQENCFIAEKPTIDETLKKCIDFYKKTNA